MPKRPIHVPTLFRRIRKAVEPFPKAALFELADEGHGSAFEQLVACILSIRTRDEVSLPASLALFARARTPEAIGALSHTELAGLIRPVMYYDQKAETIRAIAKRAAEEHGGSLPCDFDVLTDFRGVGPKCANLALGIACGATRIRRRRSRPPRDEPLGHHHRENTRADDGGARARPPQALLGRDQPPPGAVRKAHLHGGAPEVLDVPAAGDV